MEDTSEGLRIASFLSYLCANGWMSVNSFHFKDKHFPEEKCSLEKSTLCVQDSLLLINASTIQLIGLKLKWSHDGIIDILF